MYERQAETEEDVPVAVDSVGFEVDQQDEPSVDNYMTEKSGIGLLREVEMSDIAPDNPTKLIYCDKDD